jgi:hypothetical protein
MVSFSLPGRLEYVMVKSLVSPWLECVMVKIIRFSMSRMCHDQNRLQHGWNGLWSKSSVSAWLECVLSKASVSAWLECVMSKSSVSAWLECAIVQISLERVMVRKVSCKFQQTLKMVPNFGKNRVRILTSMCSYRAFVHLLNVHQICHSVSVSQL